MCGRYALKCSPEELAKLFPEISGPLDRLIGNGRYNIAPSQPVVAVRTSEPGMCAPELNAPEWDVFEWGLVPSWIRDARPEHRPINARSEEAAGKPYFRGAMRHRRCLIPATGFYEWERRGPQRQPYFFYREDRQPFAMAGLWENWLASDGSELLSCAILTTQANGLLSDLHHRMPVILPPERHAAWLFPERLKPREATQLCQPASTAGWTRHAVSTRVNSAREEGPELIEPTEATIARELDFLDQLFNDN